MKLSDLIDLVEVVNICVREEHEESSTRKEFAILRGLLFHVYQSSDRNSEAPKDLLIQLQKLYGLISGNYYALTGKRLEPLPD
jgi:hypothetical protein